MNRFVLKAPFTARGDQPQAIEALAKGVREGLRGQTLLGVTGSGKTYTMAAVIEKIQKPTLVIAHNKTLAAQLCAEFRAFFPDSAVEYFVSYYDYYQPEAYIASSDTYIEKDSAINDEIDRLRHSATAALKERRDVIIVASVSCIYAMGDPQEYLGQMLSLRPGMRLAPEELSRQLVGIQYDRNDLAFARGMFRVRGDVVEIIPVSEHDNALRVEFFGDQVERISETDVTTGRAIRQLNHAALYPATHYATSREGLEKGILQMQKDLEERISYFEGEGRLLEAQRIAQRTRYDIEMLRELGFVTGIENYSRYFDGRQPGEPPYTLLDYFPGDFLCFIDESHVTVPQIRGMYNGDRARKLALVDYGFRLPSALDNRPLTFLEFEERIIRPTGLLDPRIAVRPATGQVDDLIGEIKDTVDKGFRVLVTTLTKAMAERLSEFLLEMGMRVRYLHSDIKTMERMALLRDLRLGAYDVLVGINLLREGLDLPEVALVAILDADKEGFLRSETSLVQTVGRAARNTEGRVIMYADHPTDSMMRAIAETNRRRAIQEKYNQENGITPETINNAVRDLIAISELAEQDVRVRALSPEEKSAMSLSLEDRMLSAARNLDFEQAAKLRDQLFALRGDAPIEKKQPQPARRRRTTRHK